MDMFRIGEFSKLTQISVRMLRYYDEAGLLKPEAVDKWTGYRMYSAEQIPRLNKIIYLRDSGFGVVEIAQALDKTDDILIELLDRKRMEIEKAISSENERLNKIELAKKEIYGKSGMYCNITIKSVPACNVLSLRRVIPNYYAEGVLWKELSEYAAENKIEASDRTFSIYHDREYKEKDVDVEICAVTNKKYAVSGDISFRTVEAVPVMACTMVYGDFSNIAGAYKAFAQWLEKSEIYRINGEDRQIVHRGPWNEDDPDKYLTELQIPLEYK